MEKQKFIPKFSFVVCLISECIHNYGIKHRTTRLKTPRNIVTDVVLLNIKNKIFKKKYLFYDDKNYMSNIG